MKNVKKAPVAVAEPKVQKIPSRSLLLSLLCVFIALCMIAAALGTVLIIRSLPDRGAGGGTNNNGTGVTQFDYKTSVITDYLSGFDASFVTGNNGLAGLFVKPTEVTDKYVTDLINGYLLRAAYGNASADKLSKFNKTKPMDHADAAYVYILDVKNGDQAVDVEYFVNAYISAGEVILGSGTFGEEFDNALIGRIPAETGNVEFKTLGKITPTSVLCISYLSTIDGEADEDGNTEKVDHESMSMERIDLAAINENSPVKYQKLKEAILANVLSDEKPNGHPIGEQFKVDLSYDIDEDDKADTVHYTLAVSALVEEDSPYTFDAKIPEDFFPANAEEDFLALNGKTLTFTVVVDYSIAMTASTADTITADEMASVFGYSLTTAQKADMAKARQDFFQYVKDKETENYEASKRQVALSLIWNALMDKLTFGTLPENALTTAVIESITQMESQYSNAYYNGETTLDMESYCRSYYGYTEEEYKDYQDYANKYLGPATVKQTLLAYGIYNNLLQDTDGSKLAAKVDELVDEVIEYYKESNETVTKEELLKDGGEEYYKEAAISELANDYLLENNDIDWNKAPEKEADK